MTREVKTYTKDINNKEVKVIIRREAYGIIIKTLIDDKVQATLTKNYSKPVKQFVDECVHKFIEETE